MVSKYPCCSDCGTKLTHQLSTIRSPNEFRVRFYYCKKCDVEIVRVKKQIKINDLGEYHTFITEFVFDNLGMKK